MNITNHAEMLMKNQNNSHFGNRIVPPLEMLKSVYTPHKMAENGIYPP